MKDTTTHAMQATYQQTGHVLLHCPLCGYRVQLDPQTLQKTTLDHGQRLLYRHEWVQDGGITLGVSGGTEPPATDDAPRPRPRSTRPAPVVC